MTVLILSSLELRDTYSSFTRSQTRSLVSVALAVKAVTVFVCFTLCKDSSEDEDVLRDEVAGGGSEMGTKRVYGPPS